MSRDKDVASRVAAGQEDDGQPAARPAAPPVAIPVISGANPFLPAGVSPLPLTMLPLQ